LDFLKSTIEEKITNVDFGFNGHIHFYNHIVLTEAIKVYELKNLLKKIYIPYNKYVDSISVSIELVNPKKETTVVTWYIYPLVYSNVGVLDLDLERAKKIYLEEDIFQTMYNVIVAKNQKFN